MSVNTILTVLLLLLFCVINMRLNLAEASVEKCGSPEERLEYSIRWNPYTNGCERISCNFASDCENYVYANLSCDTYTSPGIRPYCLCSANDEKSSTTAPYVCEYGLRTGYACDDESASQSYCSHKNKEFNQICFGGDCKCAPKFNGSDRLQVCFKKMCDSDSDCDGNDRNRICDRFFSNGVNQCVCGRDYHEDSTNMKCIKKTMCTAIDYCDTNEFCIDYRCECQPNYRYNSVSKSCEYHSCTHTSNCSLYDPNQVCLSNSGVCDCKSGYEKDAYHKICVQSATTTIIPTIPLYSCLTSSGCYSNQICIDNKCECIPGYVYSKHGYCEYKKCLHSDECQTYDSNRECDLNGACKCRNGYSENTRSKFCQPINQVCVGHECRCAPNYKWSENYYGECTYFSCNIDYDCQKYDLNRYCDSYGSCLCRHSYKEDTYDRKCYYNVEYSTWSVWWVWILVIIPVVVIISALIRVTRRKSAANQPLSRRTISKRVTINDTPPFTISDHYRLLIPNIEDKAEKIII